MCAENIIKRIKNIKDTQNNIPVLRVLNIFFSRLRKIILLVSSYFVASIFNVEAGERERISLLYMLSANIGGTTKVPEFIAFAL